MEKLKELYHKYQEFVAYVLCGCGTTLINIVVYWLAADVLGIFYLVANFFAWVFSVLFAYVTNRKWVFKSKKKGAAAIFREFVLFVSGRLLSLVGDMVIMFICVSLLGIAGLVAKIFSNVFVVIFNYLFSKLVTFRKK